MFMKQVTLFKEDSTNESKYTKKVDVPLYEPKNKKPHVLELYDQNKTNQLIANIRASSVSEDDKKFLIESAKRHTVFNYEKIADYYAHSSKEVQQLMEQSALVIIDFEKCISLGFTKLTESIRKQYLEDYE
tara:strand:- start:1367 stop:1759 length:393 start_codon:yes stop_codon:yes gene_type:complete